MIAVIQRGVERKADLRGKAQSDASADLASDISERTIQPCKTLLHALFIPHDADIDLRLAEILGTGDGCDGHKADARILQIMENDVADLLFH